MGTEVRTRGDQGAAGRGHLTLTKTEIRIRADDGAVYILPRDAVAEGVKPVAGDAFFRLSVGNDFLYAVGPWDGNHYARFAGFARSSKDRLPQLWHDEGGERRRGQRGWFVTRPRDSFVAMFTITSGRFEGITVRNWFDYRWESTDEGMARCVAVGSRLKFTYSFYVACGFDFANDVLKYRPNLLPDLEKIFLKRNKLLLIGFDAGRLATISQVPESAPTTKKRRGRPKKAEQSAQPDDDEIPY